jgi:hypothetical protein
MFDVVEHFVDQFFQILRKGSDLTAIECFDQMENLFTWVFSCFFLFLQILSQTLG